MILWIALACSGRAKETAEAIVIEACSECILQDDNNYNYQSGLSIGQFPLQPETDITIEWSGLSSDVQNHAMTPEMVERLTLVVFLDLDATEIEAKLADDTLLQADISLYVICTPEDSQCQLGDFGILGANLYVPEQFTDGRGVWMLALQSDHTRGAHSFAFLMPDQSSTETEVNIANQTSSLEVDADLGSMIPVKVPANTNGIAIDWRELTKDGLGNETDPSKIDEMFVGYYDRSIEELQDDFFNLDREYQGFWSMDLGTSGTANLADLQGESAFVGFDSSGTWLMALQCSTCLNPAPRFITQVIVE